MKKLLIDIGIGFVIALMLVTILVFIGESDMFIYNNF